MDVIVRTRFYMGSEDDDVAPLLIGAWVTTKHFPRPSETDVERITWKLTDPVEDPDDTHEPDLATADPVPDEPPKAPDPEGDD